MNIHVRFSFLGDLNAEMIAHEMHASRRCNAGKDFRFDETGQFWSITFPENILAILK